MLGLLGAVQVQNALWGATAWGEWKRPGPSVYLDQDLCVCVRIEWDVYFQLQEAQYLRFMLEHHLQQNKYLGMSHFTQQKCF